MTDTQIIIEKGPNGWGGPLILTVAQGKRVVSMTGAGIHPLAARIASLAGAAAVDGFKESVADADILCVVVNCAGTLRCGVYPKKGVPTVNVNPVGRSGPLAAYIREDIYVSGCGERDVRLLEAVGAPDLETAAAPREPAGQIGRDGAAIEGNALMRLIQRVGSVIGKVTGMLFESGREATGIIMKSVIPFMAFVSALIAIILAASAISSRMS